ncbi:MAG: D-TA family PLP-dependent enzyme, partial [Cyclobacteriaceae bacterium]|nr:D-TA family PLP-dependent enzyme [Cyclobacteriaceae bacterium]
CGGSISFPIHANHPERTLSPGTTLLWDKGYGTHFPDLGFDIAAVMLTRVISKPGANKLCLDLGYKAIASEMQQPRVVFPQLGEVKIAGQSEEHLVIETPEAEQWNIGDVLYGLPWHICPTVALHERATLIENKNVVGYWEISARKRQYHV